MQSYQRFQHVGHTDFNTSSTQRLTRRNTGVSDGGGITTLGAFCAVRKPCVARCQNGVLCRFGILAGRCSRRTQKAFGTAMRLCVSLSRRRRGPAGLRNPVSALIYGAWSSAWSNGFIALLNQIISKSIFHKLISPYRTHYLLAETQIAGRTPAIGRAGAMSFNCSSTPV